MDNRELWPKNPNINEVTVEWCHWERRLVKRVKMALGIPDLVSHPQLAYLVPRDGDLFFYVHDFSLYSRMKKAEDKEVTPLKGNLGGT